MGKQVSKEDLCERVRGNVAFMILWVISKYCGRRSGPKSELHTGAHYLGSFDKNLNIGAFTVSGLALFTTWLELVLYNKGGNVLILIYLLPYTYYTSGCS